MPVHVPASLPSGPFCPPLKIACIFAGVLFPWPIFSVCLLPFSVAVAAALAVVYTLPLHLVCVSAPVAGLSSPSEHRDLPGELLSLPGPTWLRAAHASGLPTL